jgi:hypothetical protein
MGRSITGEKEGTYSILNLVENVVGLSGNVETRVRKIQDILLLRSDVRAVFDALNSTDPASMKAISDWITALLLSYRRIDVDLTINDFPTLPGLLGNYRPLINNQFDSIQLKFGPNYESLTNKIETLEVAAGRRAPVQYYLDTHHVYSPNVAKTVIQRRVEYPVHADTHHHYTVNRTSEYTLENSDPNGLSRGGIVLKKAGVAVSTLQVVPDPTNQQHMIMSVDSAGTLFYENSQAHGTHGGTGSGGDGYVAGIDLDVASGSATIGRIAVLRQPNNVILRTPQSTTDLHYQKSETYTQAEVDALLSTITSQHAMDIAIQNGLHSLRATQVAALDARVTALEGAALTFKGANNATPLPVKQIQIAELPWVYYPQGEILWVEKATPVSQNPFT